MTTRRMIGGYATAAFLAAALAVLGPPVAAQDDDIGGVVTSAAGPEAGVWVIAETDDFDTGFRKIVVHRRRRALSGAGPSGRGL